MGGHGKAVLRGAGKRAPDGNHPRIAAGKGLTFFVQQQDDHILCKPRHARKEVCGFSVHIKYKAEHAQGFGDAFGPDSMGIYKGRPAIGGEVCGPKCFHKFRRAQSLPDQRIV